MPYNLAEEVFVKGLKAFSNGHEYLALVCFEQAADLERSPLHCSYLGFSLAKVRRQYGRAIALCREALEQESSCPVHYVNLGRCYELSGQRSKALETLRQGMKYQCNDEVRRELERLGVRAKPLFPFLKRSNPLNKYCGLLLKRLGWR